MRVFVSRNNEVMEEPGNTGAPYDARAQAHARGRRLPQTATAQVFPELYYG